MAWAYTFDADLDVVLQAAHNEELEPLVILLSKDQSGKPLSNCPEYAHYYPDHQRYVHLISVKLRALGGHQVGNLLRRGQGPSYLSVVQSVAAHLKVPFSKDDSITQLEQKLLAHAFSACYQSMDEQDQSLVLEQLTASNESAGRALVASEVAAGNFERLSPKGRLLVAALVSHAVSRAVGFSLEARALVSTMVGKSWQQLTLAVSHSLTRLSALFSGLSAVGRPPYQILVPCVLHVATLRLMQAGTKLPPAPTAALGQPDGGTYAAGAGDAAGAAAKNAPSDD